MEGVERVAGRNSEIQENKNLEFQTSQQKVGDKPRNKIEGIFIQSSPIIFLLHLLIRGTKIKWFTKGPSVSHYQKTTEPPWSSSCISFHSIVRS